MIGETVHDIDVNEPSRNPWFVFLLITSVFLLTTVEWDASLALNESGSDARMAQLERVDYVSKGSPLRRLTYPLLGLVGLMSLMSTARPRPSPQGLLGWLVIFCVFWTFMSVAWSDDADLTVRRLVAFAMFCVAALAFGARLSPRQIGFLLAVSSGAFVALGVLAEIDQGTFVPWASWYRFSGVQHPNSQAICCSILLLSSAYLADVPATKRRMWLFIAVSSLVLLILTKSRTSFAAIIVALVVYKAMTREQKKNAVLLLALAMIFASAVIVLGDKAVSALGRGVNLGRSAEGGVHTLNSRTWLWMECRGYAGARPLLGYGFNAFWTPERMMRISETQGWGLGSAHSIYIDTVLNLGMIGFLGFTSVIGLSILRARSKLKSSGGRGYGFLLAFLVFYALHGLLESIFINPGYPAFASMVVFSHIAFSSSRSKMSV